MRFLSQLLIFMLVCQNAWAGLPPTTTQGQSDASAKTKFAFQAPFSQVTDLGGIKALFESGNQNLLSNANMQGVYTANLAQGWTLSTATAVKDTTNFIDGNVSQQVSVTAQTGELSQDVTPTIQTNGVPMVSACMVKTTGTDVQVCARTNSTDITCSTVASNGNWVLQPVNFTGPANGTSVGVSVKNTASSTETYNVGKCYVGVSSTPQNFGQVQQPTWVGDVYFTGCSGRWDYGANTSYVDPTSSTTCAPVATGSLSVSGTNNNQPQFKVTGGPGKYVVVYSGLIGNGSATSGSQAFFRLTDGTNNSQEENVWQNSTGTNNPLTGNSQWTINENSALSGTLFKVQAKEAGSGDPQVSGLPGVFSVYRYPSASEIAYRPDMVQMAYSGYIFSGTANNSVTVSTSYQDFGTATGATLTQRQNFNAGTVTEYNTTGAGIVFTPPRAGLIPVCAQFVYRESSTAPNVYIQLTDESNNEISQIMVSEGVASTQLNETICGVYNAPNNSSHTIKLRAKGSSAAGTADIFTIAANLEWTLGGAVQSMPSPLLMGSVTSTSTGQEHLERVQVTAACTADPCTFTGSPSITAVNRTGTGGYTIHISSGTFSALPAWIPTSDNNSSGFLCNPIQSGSTSTAIKIQCVNPTTGVANDAIFQTLFVGPR